MPESPTTIELRGNGISALFQFAAVIAGLRARFVAVHVGYPFELPPIKLLAPTATHSLTDGHDRAITAVGSISSTVFDDATHVEAVVSVIKLCQFPSFVPTPRHTSLFGHETSYTV
jgi:hypothetical protein